MAKKREISIFIDESGELSAPCRHGSCKDAFYVVSLVFHNQSVDLTGLIGKLNQDLNCMGLSGVDEHHALHSYNLIRGESPYQSFSLSDRRRLLNRSVDFACACAKLGISADVLVLDRREYLADTAGVNVNAIRENGREEMRDRIRLWLSDAINHHRSELSKYDTVKVYYDNGQDWLARVIHEVLDEEVVEDDLQYKDSVDSTHYKLLQVADLLCTNAVLQRKLAENEDFTKNDVAFFRSASRSRKRNMRKAVKMGRTSAPQSRSEISSKVSILGKRLSLLLCAPIPKP